MIQSIKYAIINYKIYKIRKKLSRLVIKQRLLEYRLATLENKLICRDDSEYDTVVQSDLENIIYKNK